MHSLVGYGWAFSAAVSSGVMDNLRKVRLFSGPPRPIPFSFSALARRQFASRSVPPAPTHNQRTPHPPARRVRRADRRRAAVQLRFHFEVFLKRVSSLRDTGWSPVCPRRCNRAREGAMSA